MPQSGNDLFKDPTVLTKWTRWLLYAQIIVSVVALIADGFEYQVLSGLQRGQAIAAAQASDQLKVVVGIIEFVIIISLLIIYLKWVYRANYNARQLGASEMEFTPGWSVGWYFIPFANLWLPYAAMKELWKASVDPRNWKDQPVPSFLGWWWFFWIVSNVMSTISFRLSVHAHSLSDLIAANVVMTISDAVDIPLRLIMITLISKVYEMQMSHHREYLTERSANLDDQVLRGGF